MPNPYGAANPRVNISKNIDSIILKFDGKLCSIFPIYLKLVQVHFRMKYEVKVFFMLWKITHHPSFSVLQTEKNGWKNWSLKTGFTYDDFLFHVWNFMFTSYVPFIMQVPWWKMIQRESRKAEKIQYKHSENPNVPHFAYLSQTTGIEVYNFITLERQASKKNLRKWGNFYFNK